MRNAQADVTEKVDALFDEVPSQGTQESDREAASVEQAVKISTGGGTRTRTGCYAHRILNPTCLPIPPLRLSCDITAEPVMLDEIVKTTMYRISPAIPILPRFRPFSSERFGDTNLQLARHQRRSINVLLHS